MKPIIIGSDSTGNTSEEAAEGINNLLLVFDNEVKRHSVKVICQGTDAGGGGGGSFFYI